LPSPTILQTTTAKTAHAIANPNQASVIQASGFSATPFTLNNPGVTTTFNVSAIDPDGDSLTYIIRFGDGTASEQ